jgi:hypothetical protein|tara:strand:- start:4380 stop:4643 length:264 start_codon:yes stop_codon:yes gene_type:complete
MDFLQDIEDYNSAMNNAYRVITEKMTIDDIVENLDYDFYLPFDPFEEDGRDEGTIDLLISHFTETEDYEKCQELVNLKKNISKTPQD